MFENVKHAATPSPSRRSSATAWKHDAQRSNGRAVAARRIPTQPSPALIHGHANARHESNDDAADGLRSSASAGTPNWTASVYEGKPAATIQAKALGSRRNASSGSTKPRNEGRAHDVQ